MKNSFNQAAAVVQRKVDEKVMKLAEEQKVLLFFLYYIELIFLDEVESIMTNVCWALWSQKQKEELRKRIILLEKQLDVKQALELEIEQLRGNLNVMRHIKYEGGVEVLDEVDLILKAMREKERELGDLEAINHSLVVQERMRNDELQDARKELVNVSL